MADYDVTTTGFKELEAQLLSLAADEGDNIQRAALRAAADVIKPALISATPVRVTPAYGDALPEYALKGSVRSRISLGKGGEAGKATVDFGDLTHIARFVDRGHVNANAVTGRTHTPAHPFIRSVEDATRAEALEAYTTTLEEGINEVLKGK